LPFTPKKGREKEEKKNIKDEQKEMLDNPLLPSTLAVLHETQFFILERKF